MDLAEAVATPVPSLREMTPAGEDGMLREDGVREVLARLQRGERIKTIARRPRRGAQYRETVAATRGLAPAPAGGPPLSD